MNDRWGVLAVVGALLLCGCATVHEEDLNSWSGRPVSDLDKHPIFLTFPVVRTTAADGTEIRDYVNGKTVSQCSGGGGGTVFSGTVPLATYNSFSSCMQNFAACHAIFYIKSGVVQSLSAIGTGGARCYSNETMRPGFSGAANIR
jgi:hypothetical protein